MTLNDLKRNNPAKLMHLIATALKDGALPGLLESLPHATVSRIAAMSPSEVAAARINNWHDLHSFGLASFTSGSVANPLSAPYTINQAPLAVNQVPRVNVSAFLAPGDLDFGTVSVGKSSSRLIDFKWYAEDTNITVAVADDPSNNSASLLGIDPRFTIMVGAFVETKPGDHQFGAFGPPKEGQFFRAIRNTSYKIRIIFTPDPGDAGKDPISASVKIVGDGGYRASVPIKVTIQGGVSVKSAWDSQPIQQGTRALNRPIFDVENLGNKIITFTFSWVFRNMRLFWDTSETPQPGQWPTEAVHEYAGNGANLQTVSANIEAGWSTPAGAAFVYVQWNCEGKIGGLWIDLDIYWNAVYFAFQSWEFQHVTAGDPFFIFSGDGNWAFGVGSLKVDIGPDLFYRLGAYWPQFDPNKIFATSWFASNDVNIGGTGHDSWIYDNIDLLAISNARLIYNAREASAPNTSGNDPSGFSDPDACSWWSPCSFSTGNGGSGDSFDP